MAMAMAMALAVAVDIPLPSPAAGTGRCGLLVGAPLAAPRRRPGSALQRPAFDFPQPAHGGAASAQGVHETRYPLPTAVSQRAL